MSENGKFNMFANSPTSDDSSLRVNFEYTTSSNLTFNDPITSLTLSADVASGIGTDTRIQIYRLDAEKVADITVASNSTQVDIPVTGSLDPAINKDSEYLLVSEWICTNADDLELYPNDLTTRANYYTQGIFGQDSSAFGSRVNSPRYSSGSGSGSRSLSYVHIKLSEIGAFTAQSYNLFRPGTTTPSIDNWFLSSTSEAITSITKLNIVSKTASQITTGSRFTLYKLK